ncbi:Protein of unknown function, partial [Gryllus bimaculatus]
EMRD